MRARPTPEVPGPGQESVWDYPRPPALVASTERVEVYLAGERIADTTQALRVLETSQAPAYYLPVTDVVDGVLRPGGRDSWCEWKGRATYFDVTVGDIAVPDGAWAYPNPTTAYAALRDHVAFYPQLMERCVVDGEEVRANEGGFYGGWVTSRVVGPFKGGTGSLGW